MVQCPVFAYMQTRFTYSIMVFDLKKYLMLKVWKLDVIMECLEE